MLNIKNLIFNWNFANCNNATHCGRLALVEKMQFMALDSLAPLKSVKELGQPWRL